MVAKLRCLQYGFYSCNLLLWSILFWSVDDSLHAVLSPLYFLRCIILYFFMKKVHQGRVTSKEISSTCKGRQQYQVWHSARQRRCRSCNWSQEGKQVVHELISSPISIGEGNGGLWLIHVFYLWWLGDRLDPFFFSLQFFLGNTASFFLFFLNRQYS